MASVGEGQGAAHAAMLMPPVDTWAIEQHGRHHPSTCRPSTRTPPQRQHDRTLEGPTALQRSHSVLQEQQWNNQGQAVQVFEVEPENETYLLHGTKEKPYANQTPLNERTKLAVVKNIHANDFADKEKYVEILKQDHQKRVGDENDMKRTIETFDHNLVEEAMKK